MHEILVYEKHFVVKIENFALFKLILDEYSISTRGDTSAEEQEFSIDVNKYCEDVYLVP